MRYKNYISNRVDTTRKTDQFYSFHTYIVQIKFAK